jgi:hypothetical protein
MAQLEKGEDKLINGDLSGTSPKYRAENMLELLENQTGDLAKSGAKNRIPKIPVQMETFYIFLCPKERKLRIPNKAQFSDR